MKRSLALGAICACILFFTHAANATTVWSTDYTSENGSAWTLYLVTAEDDVSAFDFTLTGVYFDTTSTNGGEPALDPQQLLYNQPSDLVPAYSGISLDAVSDTGGSMTADAIGPDTIFLEHLYALDLLQPVTTIMSNLNCSLDYCYLDGSGYYIYEDNQGIFRATSYWTAGTNVFSIAATTVPTPAALWLFGTGLLVLAGITREPLNK